MKSIDIKSVIIGVLGTVLVFVSIGATDKNLGDITVNSITVLSDGSGGYIKTYNAEGKQTSYLGTGGTGGFLETFDATGQSTSYLGAGGTGGFLETYNIYSNKTAYLGTGTKGYGIIKLSDQNGDLGWGRSGKK